MRIKKKKDRAVEYVCPKCKSIHYYHYRKCSACKHKNPIKPPNIPYSKNTLRSAESKQIAVLAAVVFTVRGCKSMKAKKDVLYDSLKEHKFLHKYFILTYDPNYQFGIDEDYVEATRPDYGTEIWKALKQRALRQSGKELTAGRIGGAINSYPEEFKEVVFGILNKSFQMGISPQGINKVLRRLKMDLIPLRRKSNASGLKKS